MKFVRAHRIIWQLHTWLGIVIGAQVLIWLVSGLFMVMFPIETVRGNHLRAELPPTAISTDHILPLSEILDRMDDAPTAVSMRMINKEPAWMLTYGSGRDLVSAKTGKRLSPLPEDTAIELARTIYVGDGAVQQATYFETGDAPQEFGRPGPVWRIDFGPKDKAALYVDAVSGDVQAVRTPLWRMFDFMWGLHIMDWDTRENFNSWWLQLMSALAVLFGLTGVYLAVRYIVRLAR